MIRLQLLMKHSKITILLAAALFICSGCSQAETANRFASYDFDAHSAEIIYNEKPEASLKPALSAELSGDRIFLESLKQQVSLFADSVVVVTVLDEGTEKLCYDDGYYKDGTNESVDFGDGAVVTITGVKIQRFIGGNAISDSEINIMQIGHAKTNDWSVKLEKGKDYVLILENFIENTYKISCTEQSMFLINGDMTVTALSPFEYCAKYDGLPLADLVFDIENAFAEKTAETGAESFSTVNTENSAAS